MNITKFTFRLFTGLGLIFSSYCFAQTEFEFIQPMQALPGDTTTHGKKMDMYQFLNDSNSVLPKNDLIKKIVCDKKNGSAWIATKYRLLNIDPKTPYKALFSEEISLSELFIDSKNIKWLGIDNFGIANIDGEFMESFIKLNGKLKSKKIKKICEGKNGEIYAATKYEIIKIEKDKFTILDAKKLKIEDIEINTIAIDQRNRLIIGGRSNIAVLYDGVKSTRMPVKGIPADDQITDISVSPDGNIWFSNGAGVNPLRITDLRFFPAQFFSKDLGTTRYYNHLSFYNNQPWFTCGSALISFKDSIYTINKLNFLNPKDTISALAISSDGTAWVGISGKGISIYSLPLQPDDPIPIFATQNINMQHKFITRGNKLSYSIHKGTLPKGITCSDNGFFQGIPEETGVFEFTLLIGRSYIKIYKDYILTVEKPE